jgi:hypothetical protein
MIICNPAMTEPYIPKIQDQIITANTHLLGVFSSSLGQAAPRLRFLLVLFNNAT